MNTLTRYIQLKKKAEQAQQTADKAEGAMEQVMKQLKNEFECSTLEEAEKKLKKLTKQEITAKKVFEGAIDKFEEKWEDKTE